MPSSLPALLLLPPPPSVVDATSLSAAYRPAIEGTVSFLKDQPTCTQLIIALACPSIHGRLEEPRNQIYEQAQKLLAGGYGLFCAVCAKLGVEVQSDSPGSVDVRIILLDYVGSSVIDKTDIDINPFVSGPIVDLHTFALTRRNWSLTFSVDGEAGQRIFADYTAISNQASPPLPLHGHVHCVGGGVSLVRKEDSRESPVREGRIHNVTILGGTFDHIHAGHKLMLSATALLLQPPTSSPPTPRRLIIGITGDELLKEKKYVEYLKSWKQRQEDVVDFLLSILLFTRSSLEESIETSAFDEPGPNGKAVHTRLKAQSVTIECVEIQDPYGPTITDEQVTALVVSGETRSGGKAVNDKRLEKGWEALEVFEIDVLDAEDGEDGPSKTQDFASKISSTAIRKRKADRGITSSL